MNDLLTCHKFHLLYYIMGRIIYIYNTVHAHCMLDAQVYKHTEYVTYMELPLKQELHGHTSMLNYMYNAFIMVH